MKTVLASIALVIGISMSKAQTAVTFYTSMGIFVVEIYDHKVPITGNNFIDLVEAKFYDNVIFHRVIDGFMIQGGDPTGTGSGGPGYTIPDEFDSTLSNLQKTISMANSGPNTGGSQLFINLVDNTYLDFNKPPLSSAHAVFGMVIENFSVVQAIGHVATDGNDRPLTDVVMDSLRLGNFISEVGSVNASPELAVRIFPNPVNSTSVLQIHSAGHSKAGIFVHDALGRQLSSRRIQLASLRQIPVREVLPADCTSGIYNIIVEVGDEVIAKRVLVE